MCIRRTTDRRAPDAAAAADGDATTRIIRRDSAASSVRHYSIIARAADRTTPGLERRVASITPSPAARQPPPAGPRQTTDANIIVVCTVIERRLE